MEELELLKRQIDTAQELQTLVRVMKSVAASRVREYDQAVASIEEYGRTVSAGLQVAMQRRSKQVATPLSHHNRLGAVVVGSDQGLCGSFNDRIAEFAAASMADLKIRPESRAILVVGERAANALENSGHTLEGRLSFVGDHGAITQVILRVLEKVEEWHLRRGMERIALFYNRPSERATFEPQMQLLLPIDVTWLQGLRNRKWPGRSIPTFSLKWDRLFSGLVDQHIFFTLYRAFIESLASENTSRLRAMQAAQKNIDERLDILQAIHNRLRQSSITGELLDITTGYQAVTSDGGLHGEGRDSRTHGAAG